MSTADNALGRHTHIDDAIDLSPRKGRGRPRRVIPASALCVRLGQPMHDALCRYSVRHGLSVSGIVRAAIADFLRRRNLYR